MRSGRILAAILILFGLAGALVTGGEIYSRLLYLGLILVLISALWTWTVVRSVRLRRRARTHRANVNDIFEEHFEITNSSFLMNLWIEVVNRSSMPGAAGSRLLTLVGARQKRSYTARTWLIRRGAFPLGPTSVTSGDPFGLFRIRRSFPPSGSLIVLPMILDIASFLSPPGLLPGGQVIRRKSSDVTPHASGVREYSPGDPLKRIHWPTTVRKGQLMVKEFEQDPQAEVWLFLDAQADVQIERPHYVTEPRSDALLFKVDALLFGRRPEFHLPPSTLEYAVSISASLAHYFLSQRRAVGLVASSRAYTVIPAERSERQETKILETLAFVEARGTLSIAGLVAAQVQHLPQGSSAILITPTVSPELMLAIDDLQRRSLRPLVILLAADTFGGPAGAEQLIRSLAERNIPVCPIYCNEDLGRALAGFAATYGQDSRIWHKPLSAQLT